MLEMCSGTSNYPLKTIWNIGMTYFDHFVDKNTYCDDSREVTRGHQNTQKSAVFEVTRGHQKNRILRGVRSPVRSPEKKTC